MRTVASIYSAYLPCPSTLHMDDLGTMQITHGRLLHLQGTKAHEILGTSRSRELLRLVHPRATSNLIMEVFLSGNSHTHFKKGDTERTGIKQSLEVECCSCTGNPRVT